ncbi:MAG: hypothetical protein E6441_18105, partial [Clostridium sp.]|uniref:hypothetical protein n=1 Tax=Clostridium sp. TaxID=1506 RepID=UPI00291270D4
YNDDTGYMATNKVTTIKISANLPIMFINKYGVGVNGVAADSSNSLKVKGNANVAGTLNATNVQVGGNNVYHTGRKPTPADIGASPSSHAHSSIAVSDVRNTNPTPNDYGDRAISTFFNNQYGDGWRSGVTVKGWSDGYCTWQLSNPSSTAVSEQLKFRAGIGTTWNPWRKIYHEGNKPTPAEIGTSNVKYVLLGTGTKFDIVPPNTNANFIRCTFSCGNKQEMSSMYVNVNEKYVTDWTVGGSFSMVIEFMKVHSSQYVMSMNVHCALRNSSTSYRLTTSTNLLNYSTIQKITFEHSQAGYKLENCAYTLEWY